VHTWTPTLPESGGLDLRTPTASPPLVHSCLDTCTFSASSLLLKVHRTRLSTVDDQAFHVAVLLLPALGTVCPNMSRLHPLCLFSEVTSSGVPSHAFYGNFCCACTVTVVVFGHLCVQAVGSGLCGQQLRARDESALEVAPPA